MTKREAKRFVCYYLASEVQRLIIDVDADTAWPYAGKSEADIKRVQDALREVRDELERRSDGYAEPGA